MPSIIIELYNGHLDPIELQTPPHAGRAPECKQQSHRQLQGSSSAQSNLAAQLVYLLDNEQSLAITGLGWGMSVDSDYGLQLGQQKLPAKAMASPYIKMKSAITPTRNCISLLMPMKVPWSRGRNLHASLAADLPQPKMMSASPAGELRVTEIKSFNCSSSKMPYGGRVIARSVVYTLGACNGCEHVSHTACYHIIVF